MATKNRFVGVRLEPEQQRKLILLSIKAGDPGNMSAGLRYAVDRIAISGSVSAEVLTDGSQQPEKPEKEAAHA